MERFSMSFYIYFDLFLFLETNFNPILGETFEYVDSRTTPSTFIFAEQVWQFQFYFIKIPLKTSHYPSQAALYAENDLWSLNHNASAKTQFSKNCLEMFPNSKTIINLKNSGHSFLQTSPTHVSLFSDFFFSSSC